MDSFEEKSEKQKPFFKASDRCSDSAGDYSKVVCCIYSKKAESYNKVVIVVKHLNKEILPISLVFTLFCPAPVSTVYHLGI